MNFYSHNKKDIALSWCVRTLLTVADDSTERISFEVKLNVHVLSLLMRVQKLKLKRYNSKSIVPVHKELGPKPNSWAQFTSWGGSLHKPIQTTIKAPAANHKHNCYGITSLCGRKDPQPLPIFFSSSTGGLKLFQALSLLVSEIWEVEQRVLCVSPSDVLIADRFSEQAKLNWWEGSGQMQ